MLYSYTAFFRLVTLYLYKVKKKIVDHTDKKTKRSDEQI